MVSPSSKTEIKKRVLYFLNKHFDFQNFDVSQIELLKLFLKREFDTIPEKVRRYNFANFTNTTIGFSHILYLHCTKSQLIYF